MWRGRPNTKKNHKQVFFSFSTVPLRYLLPRSCEAKAKRIFVPSTQPIEMSALILLQSLALRPMPLAPHVGASAAAATASDGAAPLGRRQLLASAGAASALALLGLPRQAEASYALYQASQVRARACARRRRHGLPDAASHLSRHPPVLARAAG